MWPWQPASTLRSVIDAGRSSRRLDELSSARVIGKIAQQVHAAQQKAGAGKAVGPITPAAITLADIGRGHAELSATASALGYSAPEQTASGRGDRRSDVFSLGAVMWEALTHQRLFDAMNDAAVKAAVQRARDHAAVRGQRERSRRAERDLHARARSQSGRSLPEPQGRWPSRSRSSSRKPATPTTTSKIAAFLRELGQPKVEKEGHAVAASTERCARAGARGRDAERAEAARASARARPGGACRPFVRGSRAERLRVCAARAERQGVDRTGPRSVGARHAGTRGERAHRERNGATSRRDAESAARADGAGAARLDERCRRSEGRRGQERRGEGRRWKDERRGRNHRCGEAPDDTRARPAGHAAGRRCPCRCARAASEPAARSCRAAGDLAVADGRRHRHHPDRARDRRTDQLDRRAARIDGCSVGGAPCRAERADGIGRIVAESARASSRCPARPANRRTCSPAGAGAPTLTRRSTTRTSTRRTRTARSCSRISSAAASCSPRWSS